MSDGVQEKLKGLSKADAIRLAEQVGAGRHKTKAAALKAVETERMRVRHAAHKSEIAGNTNLWGGPQKLEGNALSNAAKAKAREAGAAFEGRVSKALEGLGSASPSAKSAKASAAPKAPRAAKPAVDVVGMAQRVESAIKSGDPKSIAAVSGEIKGAKLGKAAAHDLARSAGLPVAPSASGKSAVERVLGRLGNMTTQIAKSKAMGGRSAAAIAVGLGVTAAMALMGRSSSAEAKPAAKADASVPGASQRNFMPAVMANHPNRGTAGFYDRSTSMSETPSPLGARAADKVQTMYRPAIQATGDVMARRAEIRNGGPVKDTGGPIRPTTMAEGVARAANTAPAQGGGAGRAPAAPEPAGKDRTKAYTDSMGRQYRNGRLIVRGQQ